MPWIFNETTCSHVFLLIILCKSGRTFTKRDWMRKHHVLLRLAPKHSLQICTQTNGIGRIRWDIECDILLYIIRNSYSWWLRLENLRLVILIYMYWFWQTVLVIYLQSKWNKKKSNNNYTLYLERITDQKKKKKKKLKHQTFQLRTVAFISGNYSKINK